MQIIDDKVVSFHYTLTNGAGEQIDSSHQEEPLSYLHGRGNLISGLERAMEGKASGEKFEITLAPDQAYGERSEDLVRILEREAFPEADQLEVGMQFQIQDSGDPQLVTVTEIDEKQVTVDGNHPLAGQTLTFKIEITEVREPTGDELSHGHVHAGGHHH